MCARFTLRKPPWPLARALGSKSVARTLSSRFNIAPTQPIVAAINDPDRTVAEVRWGLVPPHAEHPSAVRLSTFNARIETIAKAPTYRDAFHARRCAIFADGFYEWRADPDGGKTPLWIHRTDDEPFVFAGLWDVWQSPSGEETLTSATIVTQPANAFMGTIHPRMPVVLDVERARAWLAPGERETPELLELLVPSPPDWWTANPVAPRVGNARFDDPALIAAVADTALASPSLFDV
ncbi:MAG TPA: SOS response-associated peptidase [Candidatus Lustribacter sp.]|jgi:putative SOS response-associated peptidase YedK|nr:SOS response-associated peptidase [Candidatus Lustribacter sp.]